MVAMVVRDHEVGDGGEVHLQLGGILQHRLGARAGVDEQAPAVHLEDGREAPFADAGVHVADEHGGENRDLDL